MHGRSRSRARSRPARGGARSSATPTALSSGATQILEADMGVTYDGSNLVATWADQSGNGWDATQSTGGNKPLLVAGAWNGAKPVIRFDGVNSFFSTALTGPNSDNLTVYVLAQGAEMESAYRFQDAGGAAYFMVGWGASNLVVNSVDGATASGVATGFVAGATTRNLITVVWQRNTVNGFRCYRNGALSAQRNSANAAQVNVAHRIGKSILNTQPLNGDLALLAFYKAAHDDATRQANEAAILAKWGY
jgi:hypothetical protein